MLSKCTDISVSFSALEGITTITVPAVIKDKIYVPALHVCVLLFTLQTAAVFKFSKPGFRVGILFWGGVSLTHHSGTTAEERGVKGQYRLSSAVKCNFTTLFNKLLVVIKYLTAPKYRTIQLSV